MMIHLDSHNFAALVAGTLSPDEASALSAHLDGECEQCERFLAERGGVDVLDGSTDAVIARALPASSGRGNDLEFARIQREVRRPVTGWRRAFVPTAVAASLLVAGVAGLVAHYTQPPASVVGSWDGVKGREPRPVPVRLRFLEMQPGGRIDKGISGETVSATSSLIFEVEASRAAAVAIARVSPGAAPELLWRSHVAAGATQVTVDGRPAAYPLSGLAGPHRFVLIASERPIDEARAGAAAAALAPPHALTAEAPELDGLSLDVVDISVR
jgi:hypothetical protein